jgi:cation transport protein ChaC
VFNHLDEREKNGYLRILTDLTFKDGSVDKDVVYIASLDNEVFLGEASEYDIAKQICQARGASGPNCEYLLELAQALRELELEDQHVFEIERLVEKIMAI